MAEVGTRQVTEEEEGIGKVTEQNLNKMNALQAGDTPPRPNMVTHQSSSLPSTPYIQPRELLSSYRTPSPTNKTTEATSPRTARSESDGTLRPPGRTPFLNGCKYETGLAHSRRRIPYSLGGDKLESSPTKVKKHLDPEEDEKLSGDMRELYDRLLPSEESEGRRARFVAKLEKLLNERWPGNDIRVHVFGSSGNLLCTSESDVDICITTPMKALERTCLLAKALGEYGMENVVCVPQAKVPIVKIWDPELRLACDMNVNNSAALHNTRMIKTYVQIDPRVRPLAMIIKHWTRRRILNDAALGGTLSSYTWICMIINFLQTRSPKILPVLQQPPWNEITVSQSSRTSFGDDLERLKGYGENNKESLGALLFGFFRRYGHEVNYEREVISVREGALLTKQSKNWHLLQNNRLGVEEPFNVERNLGNTADDTSFRGVHLELRRAFDFVCSGRLDECCEQYEYPAHEEKFWTRPPPQPRPIMTRSQSQTGRSLKAGSGSSKGSNSGQRHRSGTTSRRASSAAAMNKIPGYPVAANGERSMSSNQIHDHLIHHYQLLQQQEQQLRLQMHQRAQATLHAQATAQVPAQVAHHHHSLQVQTVPYAKQANSDNHRRHSNLDPPPLSAPLRTVQAYYYPVPMMTQSPVQGLSPSMPPSQSITSPSSPSRAAAQLVPPELRRSAHRSGTSDSSGTLRSHSQPPASMKIVSQNGRPFPPINQVHATPQGQLQGYSTLQQYQQAYLLGRRGETFQPTPESSEVGSQSGSSLYEPWVQEPATFREYAGYYMDPNALDRARDRNGLSPETTSMNDPANRARTVSPNLSRLRRQHSRSPSPSHSSVSAGHTINFYSSESPPFQQYSRGMMGDEQTTRSTGPVIVDGSSDTSDYAVPTDASFYPSVNSGSASITSGDERPINTPTSGSAATPVQERSDPLQLLDGHVEGRSATYTPSILQFGEFPARATFRPVLKTARSDDGRTLDKGAPVPIIRREVVGGGTNGLGIDVDSKKTQDIPPFSNGSTQKATHHSSMLSGLNLASSLKPSAALSPVREVRTPSPTAVRSHVSPGEISNKDLMHGRSSSLTTSKRTDISPLATSSSAYLDLSHIKPTMSKNEPVKAAESKGKDAQRLPNGIPSHSPSKSSASESSPRQEHKNQPKASQPLQTSAWQQSTTSKKKKNNKKSASVGSASIPLDPNERKGG